MSVRSAPRAGFRHTASRLAIAAALFAGCYAAVRPRLNNWGATDAEISRSLPGDDVVPEPNYQTTRAITIDAPPSAVWPWLVQLGRGRGGLYSYDWLDVLFGVLDGPSADAILPEFQDLAAGDVIPLQEGAGLVVKSIDPEHALVTVPEALPAGTLTWVFVVEPVDGGRTRLLTRNRGAFARTPRWLATLAALEPAAFLMTRSMLRGIKRRAERTRAESQPAAPQ